MEELIKIPTSNNQNIYGRLRGSLNKTVIVFVHGLGGLMDQHIYYNGARFFEENGISSFRFNLYGWEKDARKLTECTLKTHSYDLDRVITYFRKGSAKKIIVVGHSFGGPTILLSKNKDFDVIVLWDPSYGYPYSFEKVEYVKALNMYKATWNFEALISKEMLQEAKTLKDREDKVMSKIAIPIKIINGEDSFLAWAGEKYFKLANKPKERVVIKGAGHTFDEDGVEEKLLQETLEWIKKYT